MEDAPDITPGTEGPSPHLATVTGAPADTPPEPKLLEGGTRSGKVTVRTRYPIDAFEHGVEGVETLTAQGVEVSGSNVPALIKAAEASGVVLEEV